MTEYSDKRPGEDAPERAAESFLQRFHRLKTEARRVPAELPLPPPDQEHGADVEAASSAVPEPTDADMPPIESLTADSDYRGFLSSKVSESLRRAALRKLFHGAAFNVIDELDDYAEDFTRFQPLGELVTADMRHRLEVEVRKQAERARQALLEDAEPAPDDDEPHDGDQGGQLAGAALPADGNKTTGGKDTAGS